MVETSSTVGGGKIPPCHFLHFTLTFYHLKVRIVNPALPIRPVDSFLFLVIIIFSSFFGPRVRLSWLQQSSTGRMQITVYHTVSYRVVSLQIHSRERQIRHLVGWLFLGVSAWIFMRAPCRACVAGRGRTLAVRCRGCSDTCRWSRDARSTRTHDLSSSADDRSWQTRSTSHIVFTVSGRYLDSQNLDSEIPWRYMDRYYRVKVRVGVSYDCPAYDCPDFDCTDFDR